MVPTLFDGRAGRPGGFSLLEGTFYINLSDLNNNPKTKALFQKKKVGFNFLEFVTQILNKNNDAKVVMLSLSSLKDIVAMKVAQQRQARVANASAVA